MGERESAIVVRGGEVRASGKRLIIICQSLFEAPELLQDIAALAERFGIIGLECDRLVEAGKRLVGASELLQGEAAVTMYRNHVRIDLDSMPQLGLGGFQLAALESNDAK